MSLLILKYQLQFEAQKQLNAILIGNWRLVACVVHALTRPCRLRQMCVRMKVTSALCTNPHRFLERRLFLSISIRRCVNGWPAWPASVSHPHPTLLLSHHSRRLARRLQGRLRATGAGPARHGRAERCLAWPAAGEVALCKSSADQRSGSGLLLQWPRSVGLTEVARIKNWFTVGCTVRQYNVPSCNRQANNGLQYWCFFYAGDWYSFTCRLSHLTKYNNNECMCCYCNNIYLYLSTVAPLQAYSLFLLIIVCFSIICSSQSYCNPQFVSFLFMIILTDDMRQSGVIIVLSFINCIIRVPVNGLR